MAKFELQKVGFTNPNDLTETVVLSTILEGAGGATRSFVEEEPESFTFEDNQVIHDGQTYTFTMAGKPTADISQLYAWADAGTELTITGYAYNEAIQIDNAVITFLQDPSERRVWKITARKTGPINFDDSGKLGTEFMMSANLLNMYNWQEGSTSGLAAGWSKTGGTTSFSSGQQTFSTTGSSDLYMDRDIYFPFRNLDLTFFITIDAITENDDVRIVLQYYNSSDSELGTQSVALASGTGLLSVTRSVSAGAEYARLRVKIGDNDSVTFSNPGLSIGTSTTYIAR